MYRWWKMNYICQDRYLWRTGQPLLTEISPLSPNIVRKSTVLQFPYKYHALGNSTDFVVNLREKFSPGPGFKFRSPVLRIRLLQTVPPRWITSGGLDDGGNQLREKFWLCPVIHLGGAVRSVPACRAGDRVQILVQARIFLLN